MKSPGDVAIIHVLRPGSERPRPQPILLLREITPMSDHWLVCMISTRVMPAEDELYDRIDTNSIDYKRSGLLGPSTIRFTRLAVVQGAKIPGKIGEVCPDRLLTIRIRLGYWMKEQL